MNLISELFDRMDEWRHLPAYALERRADLFFSLYLPDALEAKLGLKVRPDLVPELPVRIGTIYPDIQSNQAFKIDYLAISEAGDKAIFVELKTEGRSRRSGQDKYLSAVRNAGLSVLLEGMLDIFRATNAKRKYFCLLDRLERLGLLHIPEVMREIMKRGSLRGVNEASKDVEITCQANESVVVYVQPNGHDGDDDIISFEDFRAVVETHDDPLSTRFAQSLTEWAEVVAGHKQSG